MRILVTGREGQVVRSLIERSATHPEMELLAVGRPDIDLERPDTVRPAVLDARPDLVVSAAAYTAVDQAEDEPEKAHAINATGAGAVAGAAAELGVPVIHLSTDYVFAGDSDVPYGEDDPTDPKGVYGRTKLEGEMLVAAANPKHLIFRTAWVYSPYGKNFVKTMLKLAETRDEISVVADQWGNPTSALDIADAILHVAAVLHGKSDFDAYGIYHLAGQGTTNWSGFARHVQEVSRRNGGAFASIRDIATADFPTKARRPANSRLSTARFRAVFAHTPPAWQDSTADVVTRLIAGDR